MESWNWIIKYRRNKAEEKSRISRGKIVNINKKDSYEPKTTNDLSSPYKKTDKDLISNTASANKLLQLQTSKANLNNERRVSAFFGDKSISPSSSPSKTINNQENKLINGNRENTKSISSFNKRESFGKPSFLLL